MSWSIATRQRAGAIPLVGVMGKVSERKPNHLNSRGAIRKPHAMYLTSRSKSKGGGEVAKSSARWVGKGPFSFNSWISIEMLSFFPKSRGLRVLARMEVTVWAMVSAVQQRVGNHHGQYWLGAKM